MNDTEMRDWRGILIFVGDRVVYPVRHSNRMWLVEGVVKELHSVIGEAWDQRQQKIVPKQVGGVTVERQYDSSQLDGLATEPGRPGKLVKVRRNNLTVVLPREKDDR